MKIASITKKAVFLFLLILALLMPSSFAGAADVTLSWLPNSEPDIGGYRLYYGNSSWNYTTVLDVGNITNYTITSMGPADYYFALTAYDIYGNESDFSVEVTATIFNQLPSASIAAMPATGIAPLTVNFTGTGSDIDGWIVSYLWDFGDGSQSSQQNPSHTYNTPGTYTATLTVTDDGGATGNNSVNIVVNATVTSTTTTYYIHTSSNCGAAKFNTGPQYAILGTISSDCQNKEDKIRWTFGGGPMDMLIGYLANGGYAVDTLITGEATGSDLLFKAKNSSGTGYVHLVEVDPVSGAVIGTLSTVSIPLAAGNKTSIVDISGLSGTVAAGNTFGIMLSMSTTNSSRNEIKWGKTNGGAGKELWFTVTETSAAGGPPPPPPSTPIDIVTSLLTDGTVSINYAEMLIATGGVSPYTWSITTGSLPVGLTLNSSTGEISGVPTTAGLSIFTVQVMDADSTTATRALSINTTAANTVGTTTTYYIYTSSNCGAAKFNTGPQYAILGTISSDCQNKEDKIRWTFGGGPMDMLIGYLANGGYAVDTLITGEATGSDLLFKAKNSSGTGYVHLVEVDPVSGAVIGTLSTVSIPLAAGNKTSIVDISGLSGTVAAGNTFGIMLSMSTTNSSRNEIKWGKTNGGAGKELWFTVTETPQ
ncbi:MAG: PKD domain-containing protein [Thermodesulfobacteriota bacterium]